ncbi:MAG: arginase family protein [Anaerolineae bacterium]|nr:arginase family protein [Anaerolineae bacterium]
MDITLISVPFSQDAYGVDVGKAPEALRSAGLVARLGAAGIGLKAEIHISQDLGTGSQLERLARLGVVLAERVAEAYAAGSVPLVLGGDCLNAVGVGAGLQRAMDGAALGAAWFDAHGDFNTPEISLSGFLPGMPLACMCGYGLEDYRREVGLDRALDEGQVIMLGVRDLDPAEHILLDSTPISYLSPAEVQAGRTAVAAAYHFREVDGVYLHLDIDVLDPKEAPGVNFPTPGGITLEAAIAAGRVVRENAPLAGLCLTAFDPDEDVDGRTAEAAIRLLVGILGAE